MAAVTVNFSAASASAHPCLSPLGMTADDSIFPRRDLLFLCPSACSHPFSRMGQPSVTQTSSLLPGGPQPQTTLLCSIHPTKPRGTAVGRS